MKMARGEILFGSPDESRRLSVGSRSPESRALSVPPVTVLNEGLRGRGTHWTTEACWL